MRPDVAAGLKAWAETKLGQSMSSGSDVMGNGRKRHGTVVDYKLDTAGLGVFFVLDRGPDHPDPWRYRERYLLAPAALRARQYRPLPG